MQDLTPDSERQIARIGLAAEREYLAAALSFLRQVAGQVGLVAPDVAGLARAVEEVCLNVIEHGFEPGQPASFDVVILRRPGQLVVAVEDQGLSIDWSRLQAGAGSALAAAALTVGTDDVRFVNLGTRGNRVEIVKHLPFDHIEALIAGKGAAPVAALTEPSTAPVTLRSMAPDDAIAVARCTYAVYGYTVPRPSSERSGHREKADQLLQRGRQARRRRLLP